MRLNVWISCKGLQETAFANLNFPYKALKLSIREQVEFNSIDDIYDELISLYDEALEKGFDLGEALYTQLPFFADYSLLVRKDIQESIKDYKFCKLFNCPPFKSLDDTPDIIKDSFFIIDQEYNNCVNHISENKKDK